MSDASVHPVRELCTLLDLVEPYPAGMTRVPTRIEGTAFFPGGWGLWETSPGAPLPPMPVGGIMVVGQDYHTLSGYERVLRMNGRNLTDPTWRALRTKVLQPNLIDERRCFFTNFVIGLREGEDACGRSPGLGDAAFTIRCRAFFLHQLRLQRPALVLTLGKYVPPALAPLSPALSPWATATSFADVDRGDAAVILSATFNLGAEGHSATVVALTHPCMRHATVKHRRYRNQAGDAAERKMLLDARAHAGLPPAASGESQPPFAADGKSDRAGVGRDT